MRKLCLIFCIMLLLTSQAFAAYDAVDSYVSVDGVLLYVIRMEDGSTQDMTWDEWHGYTGTAGRSGDHRLR